MRSTSSRDGTLSRDTVYDTRIGMYVNKSMYTVQQSRIWTRGNAN